MGEVQDGPGGEAAQQAQMTGLAGMLLGSGRHGDHQGFFPRWGQRVAAAQLAYMAGRNAWKQVDNYRSAQRYQVSLYDGDVLYGPVQAWVLANMPDREQRALVVRTERQRAGAGSAFDFDDAGPPAPPELTFHFDGDRTQRMVVGGHDVTVSVERKSFGEAGGDSRSFKPAKITFGVRTLDAREAVIEWLERLHAAAHTDGRHARLFIAARWGDWHSTKAMTPRPAESVILPAGLLEDLADDLRRFFTQREWYQDIGQPWHRGFLFHGPPGTGKTSTAQALAHTLGMDVYYMPLSDLEQDTDLNRLLSGIGPRSLLLLEDIDVAQAATKRTDQGKGVSLSGLLNALDGVVTPEGLVTVMTTNKRSRIDPALLRDGRSDREIEMGYMDADQLNRLCSRLVGGTWTVTPEAMGCWTVTPAQVCGVVKRHVHDIDEAAVALTKWVAERLLGQAEA